MSMTLIQHIALGSAQTSITFSSIPQTFTDLYLVLSARADSNQGVNNWFECAVLPNNSSTGITVRNLFGVGSSTGSNDDVRFSGGMIAGAATTSNTFGNNAIYFPNYRSSVNKSWSVDSVYENNGTQAFQTIVAGLWANTAAITSLVLDPRDSGNFVTGTSATLYGITAGSSGGVTVS